MSLDQLSYEAKVLLTALGSFAELCERGLVDKTPDAVGLTPAGAEAHRALVREGFDPPAEDMRFAVEMFRRVPGADELVAAERGRALRVVDKQIELATAFEPPASVFAVVAHLRAVRERIADGRDVVLEGER